MDIFLHNKNKVKFPFLYVIQHKVFGKNTLTFVVEKLQWDKENQENKTIEKHNFNPTEFAIFWVAIQGQGWVIQ